MEGNQSGNANSEASVAKPATIEALNSPDGEPIPNGEQFVTEKTLVDRIDRSDRWIILLTAAIALSGVISAGIFGWQLSVMKGQLTEMKSAREGGDASSAAQLAQMQAQTTAMQSQLTQMQAASAQTERAIAATNKLAEEAGKAAQAAVAANGLTEQIIRPRIGVISVTPQAVSAGSTFSVGVIMENIGKMAAINVRASFQLFVVRTIIDVPSFPSIPCDQCSVDLMQPGVPFTRNPGIKGDLITTSIIEEMKSSDHPAIVPAVWLVGRIDYEDDRGTPHKTGICMTIHWQPLLMGGCQDGNYAN